jgi:hypothetical protein
MILEWKAENLRQEIREINYVALLRHRWSQKGKDMKESFICR